MMFVRLSVLTVAAALVGSLGSAAWAAPPVTLESESQRESATLLSDPRFAGKTTHIELRETFTLTGDLVSSEGVPAVSEVRCVYVGTEFLLCHGDQIFTGTIDGVEGEGTLTSKLRFKCSLTTFTCTGTATIVDAADGLAGVRGNSTFEADLATGRADIDSRVILP